MKTTQVGTIWTDDTRICARKWLEAWDVVVVGAVIWEGEFRAPTIGCAANSRVFVMLRVRMLNDSCARKMNGMAI